ncbi:hypothetical protein J132_10981 [Termitomyces sp. J132]|nr:hypothetical protein J132_10981 [Termitomyces sp. J132]
MTQLMARIDATPAPSQPLTAPPASIDAFVPPIAAVGTNGASSAAPLSLRTRFPDVETAILATIITHEFKAADLHKLDPTNRDRETAYTFNGATNQFEVSHRAAKEYKNPFSVLIPLQTYFRILAFHINDAAAMDTFWAYNEQLLELIAEYEWSAVFAYHSVFFNRRRAEMAAGDFSQWGRRDNDLLSKHVYAHRKPSPSKTPKPNSTTCAAANPNEPCRKYNEGRCPTTPCPWGQPHTCSTCGKADHGKSQHKD